MRFHMQPLTYIITYACRLFSFLHIKAFSYRPYRPEPCLVPPIPFNRHVSAAPPEPQEKRPSRLASLKHAFSFVETWRELQDGAVYLWKRMRGLEAEPHSRLYHFEAVMGVERPISYASRQDLKNSCQKPGVESGLVKSGRRYRRPVSVRYQAHCALEVILNIKFNQYSGMLRWNNFTRSLQLMRS